MLKTKKITEEHEISLDEGQKKIRSFEAKRVIEFKVASASIGGNKPILCFSLWRI